MYRPIITTADPSIPPKGGSSADKESRTMNEIIMRLKSGREFRFKCEEYTIKTFKIDGTLSDFSYKGGVGECPVYFQAQDIECIAVIGKEQNNEDRR